MLYTVGQERTSFGSAPLSLMSMQHHVKQFHTEQHLLDIDTVSSQHELQAPDVVNAW